MKTKVVNRALAAAAVWRDLGPAYEADNEPFDENVYVRHYFFYNEVCEQVAQQEGIQGETVFRQLVTKLGVDEDELCDAIMDFLAAAEFERPATRFAQILKQNLKAPDTEADLTRALLNI